MTIEERNRLYTHPRHGGRYSLAAVVEGDLWNAVVADANRRQISRSAQVREVLQHAYGMCDPEECEVCVYEMNESTGERSRGDRR